MLYWRGENTTKDIHWNMAGGVDKSIVSGFTLLKMKSVRCYKKRQFQFLGSLHMYMNRALMYVAKPQMIENII